MTASRTSDTHAEHDLLLVAALADGDDDALTADEHARVLAQVAACPQCADLQADLVALAAATPHAAIPARPRDFTLTPADAARLRPRGWRRFLAGIGSSRDVVTRPLALGLTTLGIAGLLVATVPGALPGGSDAAGGASNESARAQAAEEAAPSGAASAESLQSSAAPASGGEDTGVFSGGDNEYDAGNPAGPPNDTTADEATKLAVRDDPTGISALMVVAGLLLIIGLSLFALRWSARRLGDG